MRYPRPSPRERALLYSIWVVLLLAGMIFWFWPRVGMKSFKKIPVQIAPELQVWFAEGRLASIVSGGLNVDLKFRDKPLDSLAQVRSVHLGYDLGREKEVLFRGNIVWNPEALDEGMPKRRPSQRAHFVRLLLPNPQSTSPTWIRLYFADSR
jgi:hypothetical protein